MGDASGKLFVERYFAPETKVRVRNMVDAIIAAYGASIRDLNWMSEATKAQALDKLHKIRIKAGFPDHWRNYDGLDISDRDLLGNVFRAHAFEAARKRAQLALPVDRDEWEMTAPHG